MRVSRDSPAEITILQRALDAGHARMPFVEFFHDLRIHIFLYKGF